MPVLTMAVDLGTSFIKAGVYNTDGKCFGIVKEPVKAETPSAGIFLQKGEKIYRSTLLCMKKAAEMIKNPADIEAVSFVGQMAGFMGVGAGWEDITGWSCSLDTRYIPYAERQQKEFFEDFMNISGTNSPLFSSKYEWFRSEFPQQAAKIQKYMMLNGYIIGKLGNLPVEEAVIDVSLLTWTGLADVKNGTWSKNICSKLGISEKYLPRVVQPYEVVSHLSEAAAAFCSLRSGIPLVAGAGDKIAGCVGSNILAPGKMIFEDASFGGLSFCTETYRTDQEKHHFDMLCGLGKGKYYAHYYIPGSGITSEWFVDQFTVGKSGTGKQAFDEMNREMAQIQPGCDGLMAIGMLAGSVMPFNGDLKGVWMGFDWSHRPAHFYRALVESHAYALATSMEQMEKVYPEYPAQTLYAIGGGARAVERLQLFADVCGKTIKTADREDAALLGASLLAEKGTGMIEDLSETSQKNIHTDMVIEPDMEKNEKYQKYKVQYNQYCKEMTHLCKGLIR